MEKTVVGGLPPAPDSKIAGQPAGEKQVHMNPEEKCGKVLPGDMRPFTPEGKLTTNPEIN